MRETQLGSTVIALFMGLTACGSGADRQPRVAEGQSSGSMSTWGPPSPPSWAAAAAAAGLSAKAFLETLPCPPPGMPPEAAQRLDCSLYHQVAGAVPYVPAVVANLPREVDLRVNHLTGPVKNQGQVGSCAGFALTSIVDNAARRWGRNEVASPLHVYATYGLHGQGLDAVTGRPIALDPVWPYDPRRACEFAPPSDGCGPAYGVGQGDAESQPWLMGEKARADAGGRYRVDAFESIDPVDPDQIALLNAAGEAVWFSLDIGDVWGSLSDLELPDWDSDTPSAHAVAIVGYRQGPREREFLIQNSWGADWGRGGFALLPESALRRHALQAYRLRVSDAAWPAATKPAPNLIGMPTIPGCTSGAIPSPFGCIQIPLPGSPATPLGWPTWLPPPPACASGSLPNPFTGGCVTP